MTRAVMCVALMAAAGGCKQLGTALVFMGEHKRTVPAEFDKLEGKRILVLVWAEPETRFDFPHIRLEVASHVGYKLSAALKECEIVEPRRVEDYLERMLDAEYDPERVGAYFEAEAVVYLELLQFQIRDPSAADLLRGRVRATVAVYDLSSDPDEARRYTLSPVNVVCPEHQPILWTPQNAVLLRQQTYDQFAETVARKFYEHKVNL